MVATEEALKIGFGGISLVSLVCGLSRVTIAKAIYELEAERLARERIWRSGAGRRNLVLQYPNLLPDLPSAGSVQLSIISN